MKEVDRSAARVLPYWRPSPTHPDPRSPLQS
jgi:hypothetical protein